MKNLINLGFVCFLLISTSIQLHSQSTIAGNSLTGTLPATPTQFLGSSNNADVIVKSNNSERLRVTSTGTIQLHTSSIFLGATGGVRMLSTAGNTAAGPAYSFNGDANTGMFRIGAGTLGFSTAGVERLRMTNTGFIGIGTQAPAQNLHIAGNVLIDGTNSTLLFGETVGSPSVGHYGIEYILADKGLNLWKPWGSFNNAGGQGFQNYILFMNDDGKIGMGVNPSVLNAPGYTHRLSVCGSIRATEVVVQVGWCDYVFADDYQLMPLTQVGKYISEHQHLPDVPSAQVVESEGLGLADMSAIHMRKIEELTLYLLQQQREIEEMKATISELQTEIKAQGK